MREIHYSQRLAALARDMKYTLRTLRKTPAFTCVAVMVLAMGIGANLAVFSLIDSLFLKPLAVEKPDELLQISSIDKSGRVGALVSTVLDSLRAEQVFQGVCGYFASRLPAEVS